MIKQTFWRFTTPVITIEVGSPSLCKDICATKCIVMNLKVTFLGLKDIEIKSYSLGKKTQNTHSKTKPNQKNPPQDKETNKKIQNNHPQLTLNAYFCYCLSWVRITSQLYSFLPLKNNVALAT